MICVCLLEAARFMTFKSEAYNVSVSKIIVYTGYQQLNLKIIEINNHLADFYKKINFSLIDNSK